MIITVGFALGEATAAAAADNPDITFIGVDQFQADDVVCNLTGLVFNEDQAGFLAGALAGLLTESNTIAAVLGTDQVPPVVAFKEGFENGAEYTNPDVNVISTYHPGGLDVAFTDPECGATTARQALDNGADVVFGAGGKTGNGALIEVAKAGRRALHRCRHRPVGDGARRPSVPRHERHEAHQPGRRRRSSTPPSTAASRPATSSATSAWPTSTTSPTACPPTSRRRSTSSPSRCCRARSRPATQP